MTVLFLNFILLLTISTSHSANILATVSVPSHSHQVPYKKLWRELSLRGHKVTLITTDPVHDQTLTNLTEIDVSASYEAFKDVSSMAENKGTMWDFQQGIRTIFKAISDVQLSNKQVQDLIHNRNHQFDLVFAEFLFPEFLAFAEIYECPKIILSTLDSSVVFHDAVGNSFHPVVYPDIGSPFYGKLSFWERVQSTLYTWHTLNYVRRHTYQDKDEAIRKYFHSSTRTIELINDIDLLFLNVNPAIHHIRSVGPSTITVGDIRRTGSPESIPKDLKEFLDNAKDGFIYFSLGSTLQTKNLKKESLDAIIHALEEVPYKVLWKFENEHLPGKPNNVKLVKWAPQLDILAHPNIKLFVTQGGLQSTEEGIYNEVPFVVIPFFADQEQNARSMKSKGIAEFVERFPTIDGEVLKKTMMKVISNPSYRNAVKRLKKIALDMPMTGLEKAVWWTEYVIRNKGAKHLRNPAADLPFYQYYLMDVIGFLLSTVIATLLLLFILLRKIFKLFKPNVIIDKNKKVL